MTPMTYVILALIAIGLIGQLLSDRSGGLWIAVFVFGTIFLLYKFPPNRWGGGRAAAPGRTKPKRSHSFRVIQGNKKKDDEPPKYH